MKKRILFFFILILTLSLKSYSQCPGANFNNAIDIGSNFNYLRFLYSFQLSTGSCYGNDYGGPAEDIIFTFTLPQAGIVSFNQTITSVSVMMYLLDANKNLIGSRVGGNGTLNFCKALEAGKYYFVLEGTTTAATTIIPWGSVMYNNPPIGASVLNPINSGTVNICGSYNDNKDLLPYYDAIIANRLDPSLEEDDYYTLYHKFELTSSSSVVISSTDYLSHYQNVGLYNNSGEFMAGSSNGTISKTLATGVYYIVSSVYSSPLTATTPQAQRMFATKIAISAATPLTGFTVNAGADQNITSATTSLTGTTNANCLGTSYLWTKQSGPAATMTGTDMTTLNLSNLQAGNYVFRLSVTLGGVTIFDDVNVTIGLVDPCAPLIVNAGEDRNIKLPSTGVTLTGSVSTPCSNASSLWTKQGGPEVTMVGVGTSTLVLSNLMPGSYVFRLTATVNNVAVYDEVTVTVSDQCTGFTVDAGPDLTLTLPNQGYSIEGSISLPCTSASYVWTRVSGPAVTVSGTNTPILNFLNMAVGTYIFRLTVSSASTTSYDEVTITTVDGVLGANFTNAINLGNNFDFLKVERYFDFVNANYGDDYGTSSDDVFFTFNLPQAGVINFDPEEGYENNPLLIYILDAKKNRIYMDSFKGYDVDFLPSFGLPAGKYYVIMEYEKKQYLFLFGNVFYNAPSGITRGKPVEVGKLVDNFTESRDIWELHRNDLMTYVYGSPEYIQKLWYRFEVSKITDVTISNTNGLGVNQQIWLADKDGKPFKSSSVPFTQRLNPGTYYVVSKMNWATYQTVQPPLLERTITTKISGVLSGPLPFTYTPNYNGNISAVKWNVKCGQGASQEKAFGYQYDKLNRLTDATYAEKSSVLNTWQGKGNYNEDGISYDLNGNIQSLRRYESSTALKSRVMDDLTYQYNGNQLVAVNDDASSQANLPNGFEDNGSRGDLSSPEYVYDANGNLIEDKNKKIKITYNYLNLVEKVDFGSNNYILFFYDATGVKYAKEVYKNNVPTNTTVYDGDLVFEDNALAFINTDEGRVTKTNGVFKYQYFLKDHLGSVRVVYDEYQDQEESTATVETANLVAEQGKFLNIDKARRVRSALFDHTYNNQARPAEGAYAVRLSGTSSDGYTREKYGLAKSLAVLPGDKIQLEVYAKYVDQTNTSVAAAIRTLVANIAANTASAGTVVDGAGYAANTASPFPYGGYLADDKTSGAQVGPKAYLNYLVFDKNFNLIKAKSGYRRVTTLAQETSQSITDIATAEGSPHEQLSAAIDITETGYVYIYLSNEETTPVDVFFDDLKVTHIKSQVVQAQDYYPFGLTFNSYSRENSVKNKFEFQGQEHIDDLGLNWDSYRYRNHQPDIGRFFNIDPMASAFYYNSPYAFSENKVTTHREMEGLEAFFIHGTISDNSMWKKDVADFIMRELKPYFSTDQTADMGFKWNDYAGGGVNQNWLGNRGKRERATASRQLVAYILKNRKQGQGITLVGHSHGGNVAIQAARILFEKHNISVNIVNFNTPAWNGANDPENPWDNFGIDEMLHFFTDGDYIAGPLSGESSYGGLAGSNVKQIELKNPLKTNFWGTDQHAFDNVNWQEVLSRFGAMMDHQNSLGGSGEKKKPDADKEASKRSGGG